MPRNLVELHGDAAAEYDAAFNWYLERSPDAAIRFDAEVERAFALISKPSTIMRVESSDRSCPISNIIDIARDHLQQPVRG